MKKIVLIGAGSAMFTRGLVRDLIEDKGETNVVLVDIDEEALNVVEKLAQKMVRETSAPIGITATTERRKALKGATVVICTIGVGGRRAWEQDVYIPRKYGIYQPMGDSVMPGGISRALRMIPAMVDIANDVVDLCPEAIFVNYGNPMGPVCMAVHKATDANMVGLCHGVNQTAGYLAANLDVKFSDLQYTAVGMNHLTWFTEVAVGGRDMIPVLQKITASKLEGLDNPDYYGILFLDDGSVAGDEILLNQVEPFSWQLFRQFGAFPAALDRHVTEFFPQMFANGNYYGKQLGVDAFSFENCILCGDKVYDETCEQALSSGSLPDNFFDEIVGEHEQVIDIIESIRTNVGNVFSANLPNTVQVPNLPSGSIIESPAIADARGLTALQQEPLTPGLAGTLSSMMQCVETVVDAALEGSRKKFIQALIIDGGHGYTLPQVEQFVAWMNRWLLGKPDLAVPHLNPADFTMLDYEMLKCHPEAEENIFTLNRTIARDLQSHRNPEPGMDEVRQAVRNVIGTPLHTGKWTESEPFLLWAQNYHEALFSTEQLEVPATLLRPANGYLSEKGKWIIYIGEQGRREALETWGPVTQLSQMFNRDTNMVHHTFLIPDLPGWGSSRPALTPYSLVSWGSMDRLTAYISCTLGDGVLAIQARVAANLVQYLVWEKNVDAGDIILAGQGLGGVVALLAGAACQEEIGGIVSWSSLASFQSLAEAKNYSWPSVAFMPDVLQYFDLPEVIGALDAYPVLVLNPLDAEKHPLSPSEASSLFSLAPENVRILPGCEAVEAVKNIEELINKLNN